MYGQTLGKSFGQQLFLGLIFLSLINLMNSTETTALNSSDDDGSLISNEINEESKEQGSDVLEEREELVSRRDLRVILWLQWTD